MTTLSKKPVSLAKNKTRKNIRNVWKLYDSVKNQTNLSDTSLMDADVEERKEKCPDTHVVEKATDTFATRECCKNPCNLRIDQDNFITCLICSTTSTDIIDDSAEWRFYGGDDNSGVDPSRCGMPAFNLIDNNLTCSFGPANGYKSKQYLSSLIRFTNSNFSYKDKSFLEDSYRLTQLGNVAHFTQCIIDHAISIHKKICFFLSETHTYFRSDNKDSILYGDFDLACKEIDVPRTAKEFCSLWNCDIQLITSGCKIVQTIYAQIENDIHDSYKITSKHILPQSFIPRFCSNLNIHNPTFIKLCNFVISKVKTIPSLNQHTPQSIAAGMIYFLVLYSNILGSSTTIHKNNIAQVTGVSDVTISKINTKLSEFHAKTSIIPPKLCI